MPNEIDSPNGTLRRLFDELVELSTDQRDQRLAASGLSEAACSRLTAMLLFDEFAALTDAERREAFGMRKLPDALRARMESMFLVDSLTPALVRSDATRHLIESDEETLGASLVGTCIGTFRLLDLIGEGGSSTVFRASREAGDGLQSVALKLLRTGLYSADAQRRFRREQAILAQLTHPNIASLIEGGVSSAGIPYIAMELIDGVPITQAANTRALNIEQRLILFCTLCRTIEAAHTALVVHRDLKPSNLLITQAGELKVLDFGIAKLLDPDECETRTSSISLTPGYAAPEQFAHVPLTTAVDIYALGVLLGELLTGIRINGDVRASVTVAAMNSDQKALPSGLPPRPALIRQLRGDLDAMLTTALADEPGLRYRSAGAFADDVERYLAGKPVRAHPASRRYRFGKFARRHRVGIAIGATFALATLFGASGIAWQAQIAAHERDMARAERDAAQLEARLNGALYEFLVGLFRDGVSDEDKLDPREFLARGVAWLNAHAPDDVGSRALVFTVLGELQILRKDPTGARALLQPLVEENPAGLPAGLAARLRCTLAQAEEADGKLERAKTLAEEGIVLAHDLTGSARATLLECRSVVGTVLADLNQDAAALEMLRTALSEAPLDSSDVGVLEQRAVIEHAYAVGLFYTGRIGDAISHGESALAIYGRIKRADSSPAMSTLGNLAMAHLSAGQALAADARFEQVIALSEQYGRSTGFAQRLINAAATKVVLQQPDAALALLDRAEAMYSALSSNVPRARAQASLERGKALSLRGDYAAAEHAFADADKAIDAGYPAQHYWRGYTTEQRARVAFSRGDYAAAETQLARAIEHYSVDNGSGRRAFVRAQIFGAELALARSDVAKALGILNEIEPIAASALEADDWQRAWLQSLRGRSLMLLGRRAEAQTLLAPMPERLTHALGREHSLTRRAAAWADDARPQLSSRRASLR